MDNDNTGNPGISVNQPVEQEKNKLSNNPEGRGGFGDHPELINRKGRPPKDRKSTRLNSSHRL